MRAERFDIFLVPDWSVLKILWNLCAVHSFYILVNDNSQMDNGKHSDMNAKLCIAYLHT